MLAWQSEGLLSQNVALDLVGTPGDRLGGNRDQDFSNDASHRAVRTAQESFGASDHRVHFGCLTGNETGSELADGALRTGRAAERASCLSTLCGPSAGPVHADKSSDLLANDWVGVRTSRARPINDQVNSASTLGIPLVGLEVLLRLLERLVHRSSMASRIPRWRYGAEATLEGQGGECSPPSVTDRTNDEGARNASTTEEDLVERCVVVHLSKGAYLDTGLVHWQDEVGQPPVFGNTPVGPRQQHAEISMMPRWCSTLSVRRAPIPLHQARLA